MVEMYVSLHLFFDIIFFKLRIAKVDIFLIPPKRITLFSVSKFLSAGCSFFRGQLFLTKNVYEANKIIHNNEI